MKSKKFVLISMKWEQESLEESEMSFAKDNETVKRLTATC